MKFIVLLVLVTAGCSDDPDGETTDSGVRADASDAAAVDTPAMDTPRVEDGAGDVSSDTTIADVPEGPPRCRFVLDGEERVHEDMAVWVQEGTLAGATCFSGLSSLRINIAAEDRGLDEGSYPCENLGLDDQISLGFEEDGSTWGANGASVADACTITITELSEGRARGRSPGPSNGPRGMRFPKSGSSPMACSNFP